jgi:tetratricopeptide (TPR) repeat protein
VDVEPAAGGSRVSLRLREGNVQITEHVLSRPPRIVLDLRDASEVDPPERTAPAPGAPAAAAPRLGDSSPRPSRGVPGGRARVADVRVGVHGGFTRVVIETDRPAGYRITRATLGEVAVQLDADTKPYRVPGRGGVLESVSVAAEGAGSVASLALRTELAQVQDWVLSGPPRIVLDLREAPSAPRAALTPPSVASELSFHRGVLAFGEERWDEAQAEFERVVAEAPGDAAALRYLGLVRQKQGDPAGALAFYQRALEAAPDDLDARLDLGAALLDSQRPGEAHEVFEQVLAREPDHALAQLYAGIADYRLGNSAESLEHVQRAEELDPSLRRDAKYYSGLSHSSLRDYAAAAEAFRLAEGLQDPLGGAAAEMRRRAVRSQRSERPWHASLATGGEWDSNPLVLGEGNPSLFVPSKESDLRFVARPSLGATLLRSERLDLSGGYDGYLGLHDHESEVDVQMHLGWFEAATELERVRLALRYDYSFAYVDLDDDFRGLHRLLPSVSVPYDLSSRVGALSQLFYEYQRGTFFEQDAEDAFDRDGDQQSVGFNQFFLLGRLFSRPAIDYMSLGALVERSDPQGSEFEYRGWELSSGAGFQLPWQTTLNLEYRYGRREYENESFFEPGTKGSELIHRVTWELARPLSEWLEVSVAGSYRDNRSRISVYDYDRTIAGTYLTLRY